jgi:hypothetical protein
MQALNTGMPEFDSRLGTTRRFFPELTSDEQMERSPGEW